MLPSLNLSTIDTSLFMNFLRSILGIWELHCGTETEVEGCLLQARKLYKCRQMFNDNLSLDSLVFGFNDVGEVFSASQNGSSL